MVLGPLAFVVPRRAVHHSQLDALRVLRFIDDAANAGAIDLVPVVIQSPSRGLNPSPSPSTTTSNDPAEVLRGCEEPFGVRSARTVVVVVDVDVDVVVDGDGDGDGRLLSGGNEQFYCFIRRGTRRGNQPGGTRRGESLESS